MNPLYNMLGGAGTPNILKQLNDFRNSLTGDPRQQVQQLLNSGRVSQDQYNEAVKKANAIKQMLGL